MDKTNDRLMDESFLEVPTTLREDMQRIDDFKIKSYNISDFDMKFK